MTGDCHVRFCKRRRVRFPPATDQISGTFRGVNHAKAFATIRSYLDTAAKNNKNRYQALLELFSTGAWLPPEVAPG